MMSHPKVAIIILNWNGLEDTIECLESLKKITYPNYEVIVVDNGSEGNDAEVLKKKFGDYIYLIQNDKNYGFAEGNNIGITYALSSSHPNYVLLLNNDTIVEPKFLTNLVEAAGRDERIGICGSKILKRSDPKTIDSTGHVFKWGRIIDRGHGKVDKGQYDDKTNVIGAMAAACLYKKDMLEEIGLFDKRFITSYEDAELSWRAYRNDWRARYVPNSVVYHKRGSTIERSKDITTEVWLLYIRNVAAAVKRHGTRLQRFLFTLVWIKTGILSFGGKLLGRNNIGIKPYIEGLQELYHE